MIGSPASSWSMRRIKTEAIIDRRCCPARLLRDGRPSSIHQAGRPKQQHRACAVMLPDLSLEGNMIANWCSRSTHPRASRTVPLHTLRNARQEAQGVYLTSLWPGVHFCRCTPSGRWQLRTCPGPPFLANGLLLQNLLHQELCKALFVVQRAAQCQTRLPAHAEDRMQSVWGDRDHDRFAEQGSWKAEGCCSPGIQVRHHSISSRSHCILKAHVNQERNPRADSV